MADSTRLLTQTSLGSRLNLSTRDVQRMVENEQIPFVRLPNGLIRFEPEAVERWIQQHDSMRQSER